VRIDSTWPGSAVFKRENQSNGSANKQKAQIANTNANGAPFRAPIERWFRSQTSVTKEGRQMSKTIYLLNGPNLNMLGKREPGIYGAATLADIEKMSAKAAADNGVDLVFRQSNHEGELVDWIQEAGGKAHGLILNAGAYTHTSIAIHDAVRAVGLPMIELHLSNTHAREDFRKKSYLSIIATGIICGFGPAGYAHAISAMTDLMQQTDKK